MELGRGEGLQSTITNAGGGVPLGPVLTNITRTSATEFRVHMSNSAGLHQSGTANCANASLANAYPRRVGERCCSAPDTYQLWKSVGDANIGAPALVVANISCRISTNPAATAAGNAAGKSQDDYLVCLHPSKVLALPRIESLERAAT